MNRSTKNMLRAAVFAPAALLFAGAVGGPAHADGVGGPLAPVLGGPLNSITGQLTGQSLPALPAVPGTSGRAAGLPVDPAVLQPTASEIAAMPGQPKAVDNAVPGQVKDAVPAGLGDSQIPGGRSAIFGGLPGGLPSGLSRSLSGALSGALPGSAR